MDSVTAASPSEAPLHSLHRRVVELPEAAALPDDVVADDFRMLASDGRRVDRAGLPAALPAVADRLVEARARHFGSTALVQALVERPGAGSSSPQHLRRTDVFARAGTAWRLVATQATRVGEGVPVELQRGAVPPHAPWTGEDPRGDAIDVLRRLNERYVQSFRECDVGWYDAHLAPDYVVTNGDGSFVDRAGALAAFARPVFATRMRRFPVDDVHIRRVGPLALIEAENAYELNDGRTGVSRYTDIWHESGGRWTCVSAHITVVKAP